MRARRFPYRPIVRGRLVRANFVGGVPQVVPGVAVLLADLLKGVR